MKLVTPCLGHGLGLGQAAVHMVTARLRPSFPSHNVAVVSYDRFLAAGPVRQNPFFRSLPRYDKSVGERVTPHAGPDES